MIFCNMQTQWSTSFGGFVGLRYEVLLMQGGMFDLYNIVDRRKILEELQIMEATALRELNKEKNNMASQTSKILIAFQTFGDTKIKKAFKNLGKESRNLKRILQV